MKKIKELPQNIKKKKDQKMSKLNKNTVGQSKTKKNIEKWN